jgi:hypothetical protein
MDYNPHLKPWVRPKPEDGANKGSVERPDAVANLVWQTRPAPPSEFENRFADALVECFGAGVEQIDALVARLNEMGVQAPDGTKWTAASLERELARLGA